MKSLIHPKDRSIERRPSTSGRKEPLALYRRAWHWVCALPLAVQVTVLVFLTVLLAGPNILLFLLPVVIVVVIGLWLWEKIWSRVLSRINRSNVRNPAIRATNLDLWQWVRHLAEMVVAMYAGMFVYMALIRRALIAVGLAGLVSGDLSYTWMILFMLVPMVALMRIQGHTWRMSGEMAVGMIAPIIVCFGLVRSGICPLVPFLTWLSATTVYGVAHDAMLLGMIVVMVFRRGMYAHATTAPPPKTLVPAGGTEV
jgi:hypothetical protein